METASLRLLLINPNDQVRPLDRDILIEAGYQRVAEAKEPPVEGGVAVGDQWDVLVIEWLPDGPEMLRAIRANPPTAAKPVIGITTDTAPELVVQAKSLGVSGWIVRPVFGAALANIINKAIERAAVKGGV